MIRYGCPKCGQQIDAPEAMQGRQQACPACGTVHIVPMSTPTATAAAPLASGSYPDVPGVTIPMLISAIVNCLTAAFLFLFAILSAFATVGVGCCLMLFPIAFLILAIFEFKTYSKIKARREPVSSGAAIAIGVCEIIAGLSNLVSLVCGIIVLCNASKLDQR